jgi:hypothetical protein
MTQTLPYCRRCDLFINDGVCGMYCVCTHNRQQEQARADQVTRVATLAANKRKAMAAFEAKLDRDASLMANWNPRI